LPAGRRCADVVTGVDTGDDRPQGNQIVLDENADVLVYLEMQLRERVAEIGVVLLGCGPDSVPPQASMRGRCIETHIVGKPNEVDPAIPFAGDYQHVEYDPGAACRFWQQLVQAHRVMTNFRAAFVGEARPVQFYWGAMDLACTRFSGRPAPRIREVPLTARTG
jgi:hypothetical protein